jgi:hypothetical protein
MIPPINSAHWAEIINIDNLTPNFYNADDIQNVIAGEEGMYYVKLKKGVHPIHQTAIKRFYSRALLNLK